MKTKYTTTIPIIEYCQIVHWLVRLVVLNKNKKLTKKISKEANDKFILCIKRWECADENVKNKNTITISQWEYGQLLFAFGILAGTQYPDQDFKRLFAEAEKRSILALKKVNKELKTSFNEYINLDKQIDSPEQFLLNDKKIISALEKYSMCAKTIVKSKNS